MRTGVAPNHMAAIVEFADLAGSEEAWAANPVSCDQEMSAPALPLQFMRNQGKRAFRSVVERQENRLIAPECRVRDVRNIQRCVRNRAQVRLEISKIQRIVPPRRRDWRLLHAGRI